MSITKDHVHYEVHKAWLNGADIEVRISRVDSKPGYEWHLTNAPYFHKQAIYRIAE